MAVKRDSKALNRIITSFNNEWQGEAKKAIDRLYQLLQEGYKVDAAVSKLAKEHQNLFTLPNLQDALVEAAAYGYGIVPEVLSEGTINDWRTRLADKWDASGMKLSEKLHGASQSMRNNIIDTLQEQMRKNKSWTDAAKALYEGYEADSDILRKQDIPEYLKAVLRATGGDKEAVRTEQKALDNIARMGKRGAPTKALKTAYNELLDRVKDSAEEQIAKACKVAMEEKARYVAERIARTEMARAWADGFWAQVQADDGVVAVQFKLSTRHPFFDICDMFAKADMFGLGAGIFPKNKIPAIPVHPHCLCRYTELYEGELDISKQREQVKEAGDKWLKSLPEVRRMQVLGVRGAEDWQDGKNWQGIVYGWAGLREASKRLQVLGDVQGRGAKSAITDKTIKELGEFSYPGMTAQENKQMLARQKELLQFSKDSNNSDEVAFLLNSNLKVSKIIKGTENSVDLGNGTDVLLKQKNIQILHNHPYGESFSIDDITSMLDYDGVKGISLVTNKGHIETLQKQNGYDKIEASKQVSTSFKRLMGQDGLQKSDVAREILLDLVRGGFISWKM